MKKLTEKQAWLDLARLWAGVKCPGAGVRMGGDYVYGLCGCLKMRPLSPRIRTNMLRKIWEEMERIGRDVYLYDISTEGAKQRAAFCLRMAEKCGEKK